MPKTKEYVVIEAYREGYSPNQLRGTMTVGELRDYLDVYASDTPVILSHDNGYTYGSVSERYISADWFDTEEEEEEEEDDE